MDWKLELYYNNIHIDLKQPNIDTTDRRYKYAIERIKSLDDKEELMHNMKTQHKIVKFDLKVDYLILKHIMDPMEIFKKFQNIRTVYLRSNLDQEKVLKFLGKIPFLLKLEIMDTDFNLNFYKKLVEINKFIYHLEIRDNIQNYDFISKLENLHKLGTRTLCTRTILLNKLI